MSILHQISPNMTNAEIVSLVIILLVAGAILFSQQRWINRNRKNG